MNYVKLLNSFEDYSDRTGLPAYAQLIYYKLFAANNRAGWAEWFEASNPYLMFKAGIKDDKTFTRHRNILKQHNLIEFITGKKGQYTRYKLIKIYEEPEEYPGINTGFNPVFMPGEMPMNMPPIMPVKTPDIYKYKQTKQMSSSDVREDVLRDVVIAIQKIRPITKASEHDLVVDLVDAYPKHWIMQAIQLTIMQGKAHFGYLDGILANWRKSGFGDAEEPWEQKKAGVGRTSAIDILSRFEGDE